MAAGSSLTNRLRGHSRSSAQGAAGTTPVPRVLWLCVGALVLVHPHLFFANGAGFALLLLTSMAGLVAAVMLLQRRWLGWQIARVVALMAAVGSGLTFLLCLGSLSPGPGVTFGVLAVGLGTVAWVAVYQQLEQPALIRFLHSETP